MKIVSFGDSFVFGSELQNNPDGSQAWAGLAAHRLGAEYQTLSVPGCGNENIARQIFTYFSEHDVKDTLAVINWTWAIRYDMYLTANESWITLGPTCVPRKLESAIPHSEAEKLIEFYNNYAGHSTIWDRYRTLQAMYAAQQYLKSRGIPNIQTHMDFELFETQWHAPNYIQELQNITKQELETFEGKNFLDWSRNKGFTVTEPSWHPLEEAHAAACDLWIDRYSELIGK